MSVTSRAVPKIVTIVCTGSPHTCEDIDDVFVRPFFLSASLGTRTACKESRTTVNDGAVTAVLGPVDNLSPEGVETIKNCQKLTPKMDFAE